MSDKCFATKLRLVVPLCHTDNQGTPDHNLDLSRRPVATVVRELVSNYANAEGRPGSLGCGFYAAIASNGSEDGKAKNQRVELVQH